MFYSQEIAKQTVENTCPRCETRFHKWDEYHRHVMTVRCVNKIVPMRTSNRTKSQIVADMEHKLKGWLIQ